MKKLTEKEVYEVMRQSYIEADEICRNGHKTSARKMSKEQFLKIMHELKMRLLGNE